MELSEALDDPGFKDDLLGLAAAAFLERGRPKEALAAGLTIGDEEVKDNLLARIAEAFADGGEVEEAAQTVKLIGEAEAKKRTLRHIIQACADGMEYGRALTFAGLIEDPLAKTRALTYIALVCAEKGPEREQAIAIADSIPGGMVKALVLPVLLGHKNELADGFLFMYEWGLL